MFRTIVTRCAILSLGLVGVCAHAQSSVTISGLVDIGIFRDTNKVWNVSPIQRSNIAFGGAEDFGGGYAATFKLSHRFDTSNGANESAAKPFWHGESTVGLKGPFGSVQFGRRLDAMYNNDWEFDPWGYFDRIASPAWDLWHYNFPSDPRGNSGTAEFGRLNNGIFYDSPTFGGASIHLSGSPETDPAARNKPLTVALRYGGGHVTAMVAHGKNSDGNTDNFAGLRVNMSKLSVMGAYDVSKAGTSKAKSTTLGASYVLEVATLRAGWGQVDVNGVKAEKVLGIGAVRYLSKRTSVYVDFAHKTFPSFSANTYGVGLAHSF